ncbi:MAG: hypothetical protein IRY97_12720, partial [Thermomicrobiaceae bacterium]|nr:hypothetical protein [Thermomicrobiaceae bacterium]
PREFAPLAPAERARLVRVDLPCSPCGLVVDPPCGARVGPACVTGIAVEAVLAAVEAVEARDGHPAGPPPGYPMSPLQTA